MKRILTILVFIIVCAWGCCPEQVTEKRTKTIKMLAGILKDSVTIKYLKPRIEITDESATFVEMPSVEVIDTVIRAKETLRDYSVKITRTSQPVKKIVNDSTIKEMLEPLYSFDFTPVKPDTLFREIVTNTNTKTIVKPRPWYEIPLYVMTALFAFAIGLFIGSKLKLL